MAFKPPYSTDINFNGDWGCAPIVTYTDKDGTVVPYQEISDYSLSLESPSQPTP